MKKLNVIYITIIIGLVSLEQLVKYLIINNINLYDKIVVISNLFNITYVKNTGAAWSMLQGRMSLFYVITLIALVVFINMLVRYGDFKKNRLFTISIIFIIAGTLGNFIDRLFLKYVVDYLEFFIFDYGFPVFNLPDIFLTLGTAGFAFSTFFNER